MKRSIFISLLLFVLAFIFHTSIAEPCVQYNCQTREKCDGVYDEGICNDPSHVCCQLVRRQFRTECRQFGGECMKKCNPQLREYSAKDCPVGTNCCILVF